MTEYYLFSHGLYFRPEARGYTGIRDDAGLFEKDYAEKYCAGSSAVTMKHKDDPKAPEFMPVTYPDSIIGHLKKQRDEAIATRDSLMAAFGMFLNGMSYRETFPDNLEDFKSLEKSATYNFLRARNHIPEALADLCNEACKKVYTEEHNAAG